MLAYFTGGVAGFISESIQGVGGSVPLADGYLPAVYDVRSPAHLPASRVKMSHNEVKDVTG